MKFYNAGAPNPRRVRIFLAEKGAEIPRVDIDLTAGDSRTPEFLAMNSLGGTPVLTLDDGTVITESVAISRFLEEEFPEPPLFGTDQVDRARVEMWIRRMEIEIQAPVGNIAQHTFDFFADKVLQVPEFAEAQRKTAKEKWIWLDREMSDGRSFVTGDKFTMADIVGMTAIQVGGFTDAGIPDECVHLKQWEERLKARPSWDA